MNRVLNGADERLHALLEARPKAALTALLALGVTACFALLMMTRTLAQLSGAGMGARAFAVFMICLPLVIMLLFARRAGEEAGYGLMGHVLLYGVCAAAMLARVSFIDRVSSDYEIYLSDWLARFDAASFSESMKGTSANTTCSTSTFSLSLRGCPCLRCMRSRRRRLWAMHVLRARLLAWREKSAARWRFASCCCCLRA